MTTTATKMVVYLVPPGVARCESWGKAEILATGCVRGTGAEPFALFFGPEQGAPPDWVWVPPREQLPDGVPVESQTGYACTLPDGRIAEWVSWCPPTGKVLDQAKLAVRVAAVLQWWSGRGK